jgi:hypothetical protein
MTPILQPENAAEMRYNEAHRKTRVVIECAFGRLKKRFRVLHDEMRVSPAKAATLIAASIILHNIAENLRMPIPEDDDEIVDDIPEILADNELNLGHHIRQRLVETYFS